MGEALIYRNRYVCSLDWLQLFCHLPKGWSAPSGFFTSSNVDSYGVHRTYRLGAAKEFLKGYSVQHSVWYKQYNIATIAWSPVDSRVSRSACAIKLANPVLYVSNWRFILEDLLSCLHWQVCNITRVDFCIDFNKFANGLLPQTFLRDYISNRTATRGSYMRYGSNKFCTYAQKHLTHTSIESVRWGSRESGVSTYMYNKSLELTDKKYKEWIVNAWKSAGLIVGNAALPVWRIEFSVSSKGLALLDKTSGAIDMLSVDMFDDAGKVQRMCQAYCEKFFHFRRIPPKTRTLPARAKNLPDAVLINWSDATSIKPITLCRSVDSGRTERMISRRLTALVNDIEDYSILEHSKLRTDLPSIIRTAEIYDEVAELKSFRNQMRIADELRPTDHVFDDNYISAISRVHFRNRDRALIHSQLVNEFVSRGTLRK